MSPAQLQESLERIEAIIIASLLCEPGLRSVNVRHERFVVPAFAAICAELKFQPQIACGLEQQMLKLLGPGSAHAALLAALLAEKLLELGSIYAAHEPKKDGRKLFERLVLRHEERLRELEIARSAASDEPCARHVVVNGAVALRLPPRTCPGCLQEQLDAERAQRSRLELARIYPLTGRA